MPERYVSRDFLWRAEEFQKRIGYQFNDPGLLRLAFTQRSSENSQSPSQNNDRLEFLGDAAIGLIVGAALYNEYPEADEGFMTIERAKLVCGQNLTAWGYEAGFDRMISVAPGVEVTPAMVEDSVEAVAGALFLDGGLKAVKGFLQSFKDYPDQGSGFDARRHLERDCEFEKLGTPRLVTTQKRANGIVMYETVVTIAGQEVGTGLGRERFEAERNAARDALSRLTKVTGTEQQKRSAVLRARFRRLVADKLGGGAKVVIKRPASPQEAAPVTLNDPPVRTEDGVEYRYLRREGPEHEPSFVVGIYKDGEKCGEAVGPNKKEALKAAMRKVDPDLAAAPVPASPQKSKPKTTVSAATPAAPEGGTLRESPELKGTLQMLCERRKMPQPRYVDVELDKNSAEMPFTVAVQLGGETVVTGCGKSKKAAAQQAAWKAMQLLFPERIGIKTSSLQTVGQGELSGSLENAFAAEMAALGRKRPEYIPAVREGEAAPFACSVKCGTSTVAEMTGVSKVQSRLHATIKAVDALRLWAPVLERMGVNALPRFSAQRARPDSLLEANRPYLARPDVEIASARFGGTGQSPLYYMALFDGDTMVGRLFGPNKKIMELSLALHLLIKTVQEHAQPAPEAPAARSVVTDAASTMKAPAPPKKLTLKERLSDWFRRIGDAYTK